MLAAALLATQTGLAAHALDHLGDPPQRVCSLCVNGASLTGAAVSGLVHIIVPNAPAAHRPPPAGVHPLLLWGRAQARAPPSISSR